MRKKQKERDEDDTQLKLEDGGEKEHDGRVKIIFKHSFSLEKIKNKIIIKLVKFTT